MSPVSISDIQGVLPETIVVITALLVIIADALRRGSNGALLPSLSVLGLVAAGAVAAAGWGGGGTVFNGTVFADGFAVLFRVLFAVIGVLTILFSPHYLKITGVRLGEYYALILTAVFGMMVMCWPDRSAAT
jgi:NADH-quinone oxidoreductase subunit N